MTGLFMPLAPRLFARVDDLVDGMRADGLDDFEKGLAKQLGYTRSFRIAMSLQHNFFYPKFLANQLANRFEILLVVENVLRQLITYNREQIDKLLGERITNKLMPFLMTAYSAQPNNLRP